MAYVNTTFLPKTAGLVFGDRLEARAQKGRVFLMAGTPSPDPLTIVSNPVLSGDPYIGSVITCANPVVSGGLEPYSYDYMWLDTSTRSDNNSTTLLEFDKDKNVSCYVTVVSADGQTVHATSNSIGPVTYAPADVTIIGPNGPNGLLPSYDATPGVRVSLQVEARGLYDVSYTWQFRKADDSGWIAASEASLAAQYPDADALMFEVNDANEPIASSFMMNFLNGPGPTQFRCRVRDTDPDGNFDQKIATTNIVYS